MSPPVIDTRRIRDFGRGPFLPRRNDDKEKKSILNAAQPSLRTGGACSVRERERNEVVVVVGVVGGGEAARKGDREMTD